MYETRVLSGMRPTGSLHLGNARTFLVNWALARRMVSKQTPD